jgi:hypothetical protein
VRRVMIERYGIQRFLQDLGGRLIHRDSTGTLYRVPTDPRLDRRSWRFGGPVTLVEVLSKTPEADGRCRSYFLRVPPECETARAAVAWSFGLDGADYQPAIET